MLASWQTYLLSNRSFVATVSTKLDFVIMDRIFTGDYEQKKQVFGMEIEQQYNFRFDFS